LVESFERLLGEWHGDGTFEIDGAPRELSQVMTIERLGAWLVLRTVSEPAEVPDSIAIIGGAPDSEQQPMHYFDVRGVKRLFMMQLEGSTWTISRAPGEDWNGPDGPGFNQRYIAEIAADGRTITGRWERGMGERGDQWETDVPIDYRRVG
jgi:hypothetical protein